MAKVIFMVYHGQGHINPCFRLARILTQNNYDVLFAGHPFFKNSIESQDLNFHPLKSVPFGLGFENWVNKNAKKNNLYWHNLHARWTNKIFLDRKIELENLLFSQRPDYILFDSWLNTDILVIFPFLARNNLKVATFSAMLSITLEPDVPPLSSVANPDQYALAQMTFHLRKNVFSFISWLKYMGKNNRSLIRYAVKENRIPPSLISKKSALFGLSFNAIPELVMMPKEFEFPSGHRSPSQIYLGYMIDDQRIDPVDDDFEYKFNFVKEKIKHGAILLYLSFGTVPHEKMKSAGSFLKKLLMVVRQNNYVMVVSGNVFPAISQLDLPDAVYVFNRVPQLRVLDHADVFISHGGLNSVKESLWKNVPLLIYPLDENTDQPGNAARVSYHGLGLSGDLKKDNVEQIDRKIKLLLNEPSFAKKIDVLNAAAATYTDENFIRVIRQIPPTNY